MNAAVTEPASAVGRWHVGLFLLLAGFFNSSGVLRADLPLADPLIGKRQEEPRLEGAAAESTIHVEVLMVTMPSVKAILLEPELRDPTTVDGAVAKLLAAVNRKEATLAGYPLVYVHDGEPGESESSTEFHYAHEFRWLGPDVTRIVEETPSMNRLKMERPESADNSWDHEGPRLTAQASVSKVNKQIYVEFTAVDSRRTGVDSFLALKRDGSTAIPLRRPRFGSVRTQGTAILRSEERRLVGSHSLPKPSIETEFFILQASSTLHPRAAAEEKSAPDRNPQTNSGRWNISSKIRMFALANSRAVVLLPSLRDPTRAQQAMTQLLRAVDRGDATLIAQILAQGANGDRVESLSCEVPGYPSSWNPPPFGSPGLGFARHDVGVRLETTADVDSSGESIHLDLDIARHIMLGKQDDEVDVEKYRSVLTESPVVRSNRSKISAVVRSGQPTVIAVHQYPEDTEQTEIWILESTATSTLP